MKNSVESQLLKSWSVRPKEVQAPETSMTLSGSGCCANAGVVAATHESSADVAKNRVMRLPPPGGYSTRSPAARQLLRRVRAVELELLGGELEADDHEVVGA